jgi:hypothetical protein
LHNDNYNMTNKQTKGSSYIQVFSFFLLLFKNLVAFSLLVIRLLDIVLLHLS